MSRHRCQYKSYKSGKLGSLGSKFLLFDEFGVDDCKVELIKDYPCVKVGE